MTTFPAVRTLEELDALDDADIMAGYSDGWDDPDEPGHNRGPGYHHGWRCAQMDKKRMEIPWEHRLLVRAWVQRNMKGDT